jgi:hypothetical protein
VLGIKPSQICEPLNTVSSIKSISDEGVVDSLFFENLVHDNSELLTMLASADRTSVVRAVPVWFLANKVSFEAVVRAWYANPHVFDTQVLGYFRMNPAFRIVEKIRTSFELYGARSDAVTWNTCVHVYNTLQQLIAPGPSFDVTIDWVKADSISGFSQKANVYLDGIFGILIHYKGKHVLTIGVSFTSYGEVLVHQIQMKHSRGNRFLFQCSPHYMVYFSKWLKNSFSGLSVYCIDVKHLVSVLSGRYYDEAARWRAIVEHVDVLIENNNHTEVHVGELINLQRFSREKRNEFSGKYIHFLKVESPRVAALYGKVPIDTTRHVVQHDILFHLVS